MGLLESLLKINSELNPQCTIEKLARQVQFFTCEVRELVGKKPDPVEKIKTLLWFLFEHKKFQVADGKGDVGIDHLLVDEVLEKRRGSPLPIAILIQEISKEIGVKLEFVSCQGFRLLKMVYKGKSFFVDVVDKKVLSTDDLLKLINRQKKESVDKIMNMFEVSEPAQVLKGYLNTLKITCEARRLNQQLLKIYDVILDYYPTSVKELGERALLLKNFGEDHLAQMDLRRYFSFVNADKAPKVLREIKIKPKLSVIDS
jgi:regulator of sirC expression with transglutaminase-like and TPR domain